MPVPGADDVDVEDIVECVADAQAGPYRQWADNDRVRRAGRRVDQFIDVAIALLVDIALVGEFAFQRQQWQQRAQLLDVKILLSEGFVWVVNQLFSDQLRIYPADIDLF